MKMITAIINKEDTRSVCSALVKGSFSVTRLSTTGGFLMAGNTTLLIGVEDEKVEACIEVIRKCCHQRTEVVPSVAGYNEYGPDVEPVEITVGGATVFVTNVERFEKL
ncbi:MAG: cyclic-di-AMP receptor [Faecalibacterium sp.]|jgi:uncharacterized protein YaaQ|nr:cyclic-di-AMP receptor [Faecalibacterium sp.]